MKTESIQQSIINNYRILSKKIKPEPVKNNNLQIWGLQYKSFGKIKGFVTQFGLIERKGARIDIYNNEVYPREKPFYATWKRTLKNINVMLKKMIENFDNEKVVKRITVKEYGYRK